VRWGNREVGEVYLRYLEGNQEVVAGVAGCGVAVIWMLPSRVISARRIEWVRLTCATRRRTIGHRDVVVRVHFLFVLRHTGWRAFWHWNIVVRVLYIRANQSTVEYTRMNDSSPSSTGLLVGATFLEVWPSLSCRRGRYTSFRCSGCSSRYFSFFLIMLSSSTFKPLSLFWSASESDAVEESFSISSSRSGAHYNLQVLQECVKHTPCVLFHQGEVSGLLPLCLVLL
jgi:hypothetical protein